MINTVLSRLNGVILNFLKSQIVCNQSVCGVRQIACIEANNFQVVMFWESKQVATPLSLLWTNKSVVAVATYSGLWTANDEFVRGSQKIAALKAFLMRTNWEVINTRDIFSNIIEILDVDRSKFLSILLAQADSLNCFFYQGNIALIRLANAVVNKSHTVMWAAHCGQTAHLSTCTEKSYCGTAVDTTETVCH